MLCVCFILAEDRHVNVEHAYNNTNWLGSNYRAVGAEEQDVVEAAVPDFRAWLMQSYHHWHAVRYCYSFQQLHLMGETAEGTRESESGREQGETGS